VVFSPDGKLLISGDEGGALRFFDASSGEIQNVIRGHDGTVLALVCIPNSRILVSAGNDKTVRFWDLDSLQELKRLKGHYGQGRALAVSPDGKALCTGDYVWQIESVAPLKLADTGQELLGMFALWCFFTPDNQYLVINGSEQGVRVWHAEKNRLHKLDLKVPGVKSIRWKDIAPVVEIGDANPEDLLLLLLDQYSVLSDTPERLKNVEALVGTFDHRFIRAMAVSPNGQSLAAFGYSSRIQVHDLESGTTFAHDGHSAAVQAVAISPEGSLIASGGDDKQVRLWKRSTRELIAVIPIETFAYAVCFSPDGETLAIGDNGGKVYLCDRQGRSIGSYQTGGRINDLAFDERGQYLAAVGFELHLYDLAKRAEKAKIAADSSQQGGIAVSPDGRWIIGTANSMSAGETFKVPNAWSVDGAKLTPVHFDLFNESMGHRSFVQAVAFSPDASLVAATSDSAIRLWDFKKKKPVGSKMAGHTYSIHKLKFSPDGRWIASGSWDGTARIWDVATCSQIAILDADVFRISSIDFSRDGHLVTANWDGTVHLWELPRWLDRK
jgi:WD40 repeat protein